MPEPKAGTPAWLKYGMPLVLIAGGIWSLVTKEFFIAGGSRGGSGRMTGQAAVIAGGVLVILGVLAFLFFRYLNRKNKRNDA
ncbi:MAG: hypothetical protein KF713_14575 [Turneriella sp.]|nr:hypothetical protein [Turneriella sp.]